MLAHRMAQYATTESNEKGELMWIALSRRWFMGKDTDIRPIRLDSHEMLLECASFAGLNMDNARRVLQGEIISEHEIHDAVDAVHAMGIHSIPLLVFEVDGMAKGSWLSQPQSSFRMLHHGSGSKESMRAVLEQLHRACQGQPTPQPSQPTLKYNLRGELVA